MIVVEMVQCTQQPTSFCVNTLHSLLVHGVNVCMLAKVTWGPTLGQLRKHIHFLLLLCNIGHYTVPCFQAWGLALVAAP